MIKLLTILKELLAVDDGIDTESLEIPLTYNVKEYINHVIESLKHKNMDSYDRLVNGGWFQNQFKENILRHFAEEFPKAISVSEEVMDYIGTVAY
jgi:hypothetical protein